ncbi:MAG TPA: helix-turn-helix domain-containing protein [Acidimicrobiales bacterium]
MTIDDAGERMPDRFTTTRFAIIPEWLLEEPGEVVRLYGWLDRFANRDGELWPSQEELAIRMECSERHVRTLMARLREVGALEILKRRWNGSTVYRLVREVPAPQFRSDRNDSSSEIQSDRNHSSGWRGTTVPPNESHRTRATSSMSGDEAGTTVPPSSLLTEDAAPTSRSKTAGGRRAKPSTPFPEVFHLTDAMRAWALKNTPGVDVNHQTRQFAAHHRAKGSTMKDWEQAWRFWMGNAKNWAKPERPAPGAEKVIPFGVAQDEDAFFNDPLAGGGS